MTNEIMIGTYYDRKIFQRFEEFLEENLLKSLIFDYSAELSSETP